MSVQIGYGEMIDTLTGRPVTVLEFVGGPWSGEPMYRVRDGWSDRLVPAGFLQPMPALMNRRKIP